MTDLISRFSTTMRSLSLLVSSTRKSLPELAAPFVWVPTINSRSSHHVAPAQLSGKNLKSQFENVFPSLIKDLTEDPQYNKIPLALTWYKDVLEYNCVGGKMNRGLTILETFLSLKKQQVSAEELNDVAIAGWGMEMLQAYYLLLDDYIDQSETRRGQPCWYKTRNLGAKGINDGFLIENGIYELFFKHFAKKPFYRDLLHLFKDMNTKSIIGEALDLHLSRRRGSRPNFSLYTNENYDAICKFKSSYYTFYMPVATAMILAGIKDRALFDAVWQISLPLGIHFQAQDDFIDCYGDPKLTGKIGTDIKEGKCTWLAVKTLSRANDAQKKTFEVNYGSAGEEDIKRIKDLYDELQMPKLFEQHMDESFELVGEQIQKLSEDIPKEIFTKLVDKIYKRNK